MENTRRSVMGLAVGAIAASGIAQAAAAAIDPLKAPRDRFWVAALTPMDSRGDFDPGAYDAMLAYWKSQGADGVLVLGTTGEAQAFSVAERKRILEQASRNKHGLDFIVGTGTANLPETIELSRHAADNGADSVLIVPPFYDKNPKGQGVTAYFDQVFAQIKTPVRYYHIPRVTGVPVDVSVFKSLTQYPNFVGVKDSNGDPAEFAAITAALPGLNVVTGTDNNLEATLKNGNGCILASGNVYTHLVAAVFQAHRAGQDVKPAIQKLADAQVMFKATAAGASGSAANKYAVSLLLGRGQAHVRPPGLQLEDAHKPQIEAAIQQLRALA
ncbi:MAG TPA: dihydrodipicolinate synthase family protein [Caulobacteraceae bacterium]|nr:dihydrodipicolinate synthase family protein [Caulobacteraceae bacterium]